ncbi:DUF4398 domain-containing protein [Pseudomonas plecoglossicida]|uniref:DUF4398 domain-containing protein n=1 Tax=Pseudomonas plecoglossicida TaxID=70775 RepID=A0AAD0R1E7_PSEDL|nr:DUF4398 domain-containing protein [Pseudomonas plecoglossicida]AXM98827.1 DUF4398 domain-containing protein [Pseudomonas plecoglossicida]EPB97649.1 hypothetical protein L321_01709 [Pseudomonas plecoglossicida NB2011]QLB54974.1 DUF4398 domain-containing protein [Pseudomonas plecoglossicida]GLR37952.1 hypothetical protein GCM10011247_33500 [Pseudomonas plecoglossicida]
MRARFTTKALTTAGVLLLLGGCARAVMPSEQIELTRSAVNRAVSADATHYAPLEMRAAQDKLSAMDRALGLQDLKQARRLAELAEADARLAERKALALKNQEQLEIARKGIEVLRQEMLEAPDSNPANPAQ